MAPGLLRRGLLKRVSTEVSWAAHPPEKGNDALRRRELTESGRLRMADVAFVFSIRSYTASF